MLQSLIKTPSVSCTTAALDQSNLAVINELATWLESLGFRTTVQPLPNMPGKANLIATLGKGTGGLVLAGHTDTVPYDDAHWSQSPFALTERDGRFYGLGTCDMKGFFPIAIEAARQFAGTTLNSAADDRCDFRRRIVDGRRPLSCRRRYSEAAVRGDRRTDRLPADLRP